jgi:hypothetical protein
MRQTGAVVAIGLLVSFVILAAGTDLVPDDIEWLAIAVAVIVGVAIAVASRFRGL